jgi:hypothetical protein
VDTDDDAMVDNNWYAVDNGLGSLDVHRSAGRCVRGALGESAALLAKGEEQELLMAFFWILQRTAKKKQGNVLGLRKWQVNQKNLILKIFLVCKSCV